MDVIQVSEFSIADYAHALLGMPAGDVCFEAGIEDQLLRLAVHQISAGSTVHSREDQVFSLHALLCWVLYVGMRMQENHSVEQSQVC